MNARSVSNPAWRKPGQTLTLMLLLFTMFPKAKASDIVITMTGVLTGGWDTMGIFYTGSQAQNMGGKPFTLVFTFDDTKGTKSSAGGCPNGLTGDGTPSPGSAVLTIGTGSFTFGPPNKFSYSGIYRDCEGRMISVSVSEKKGGLFNEASTVEIRIVPPDGTPSLPRTSDWRTPMSTTAVDNQSSCFIIMRQQNSREIRGCFDIKKVVISGSGH